MPYSIAHKAHWTVDQTVLAAIEGAEALSDWFGFLPEFHDATIEELAFEGGVGTLTLAAFRMTSEIDQQGFFVLDRHARVSFHFEAVSGAMLDCDPNTTILELGVRRLGPEHLPLGNTSALAGDYQVAFDDVCGGSGSIFARQIKISVTPRAP